MEISPQYSLEGLMLKKKLQYFGHLKQITDPLEKTLILGKVKGQRRKGWQRMRWLDGITDEREFEQASGVGDGQGSLLCCSPWGHKELDTTEWLNWTELKGTFLAKMGTMKDRNGRDLKEAEDIKKRWQEYTELYKKDIHDSHNHNGVITHLEPDIMECEVKWVLGSITMNKASGDDGISVEQFQILKEDAVKVLHSICQQI